MIKLNSQFVCSWRSFKDYIFKDTKAICLKCVDYMKICFKMVSGQLPPEENSPLVRVGVWVKVRVSFRVGGGQPYNCSRRTFSPVTARVWLRVSFKVGGQFSSGEIVLKPTK